jgi:V/A-type H+-transporting ATPase subunit I
MIAPMKKAVLFLRERDKTQALKILRRLGLVHADPLVGKGDTWENAGSVKTDVELALGILLSYKTKKEPVHLDHEASLELVRDILGAAGSIKESHDSILELRKEMERIRGWGDFDPLLLENLRGKGLDVRMYEVSPKAPVSLPADLPAIRMSADKNALRYIAFPVESGQLNEFIAPKKPLSALKDDEARILATITTLEGRLSEAARSYSSLKTTLVHAEQDLTLETLRTGMEADGPVAWICGWVPSKDAPSLGEAAAKHGWGLLLDDPLDDELPPTKVENNALVRIIAPVFDFLGTVPHYREYDISGMFLLFFTIFFAMIFGDGGYGSLVLFGGIAMVFKLKMTGGKVPDTIRLLLLLSSATVAWGLITGSWFGIDSAILPSFLRNMTVYWIANENPLAGPNIKQLCFIIGAVQLSIAHLKNIRRDIRSLKVVAQLGLLMQVLGMYFLVLNFVLDAVRFPMPLFAIYLIGIGFALNFIFANYEGNIIKSMLSSLANIVSMFLGIVNVFADIVSYIRLWAVGLAGLAISQTVNSMAGPMFGKAVMFAFGVMLLLFGHGLNILLSLLSVVVHGVRLNMLEFSGHLGMEWSGFKYEPFREAAKEEIVA